MTPGGLNIHDVKLGDHHHTATDPHLGAEGKFHTTGDKVAPSTDDSLGAKAGGLRGYMGQKIAPIAENEPTAGG